VVVLEVVREGDAHGARLPGQDGEGRVGAACSRRRRPVNVVGPFRKVRGADDAHRATPRYFARMPAPVRPIYVGSPDTEDVLVAELRRRGDAVVVAPGFVQSAVRGDPIFARTVLPRPLRIAAASVDDLATALLAVEPAASFAPTRIHVFAPELPRRGSADKEEHPLAREAARLTTTLQQKAEGRRVKGKAGPITRHTLRVALIEARTAFASVDDGRDGDDALTAWPGPFPGGRAVAFEAARDAPSSAHRKLEESFAWLALGPGADDVAVDLGAAPGGWTRVLRDRGARVVAVDRGALDEALQKDPGVTWLRRDALDVDLAAHAPQWVVCDVIWAPAHTLTVVRRALACASVRGIVATLKLTRPVDFDVLDEARELATGTVGFAGRVKHLVANKLEVTLLMRRGDGASTAVTTTTADEEHQRREQSGGRRRPGARAR
jgi:hypothetical protein